MEAPACPGAPEGVRNIVWLKPCHLPQGVRGLAAANLHRLASSHGRHGCKVEFSRPHAFAWLASALAAGRPLRALLGAYAEAVRAEEDRCRGYSLASWSPGRVIARARRKAYGLGIVTRWHLDEYAEGRVKARERRAADKAFLARLAAEDLAAADLRAMAGEIVIPWRAATPAAPVARAVDQLDGRAGRIAALKALAASAKDPAAFERLGRELAALGHVLPGFRTLY